MIPFSWVWAAMLSLGPPKTRHALYRQPPSTGLLLLLSESELESSQVLFYLGYYLEREPSHTQICAVRTFS